MNHADMNQAACTNIRRQLDDLVDGYLAPEAVGILHQHLAGCDACVRERDARVSLRQALRDMPVPAPRAGFAQAALAAAVAAHEKHEQPRASVVRPAAVAERPARPRWSLFGPWLGVPVGMAAAAALAAVLWLGSGPREAPGPGAVPDNDFDGIRIALYEPRDIGLAIDSATAVQDATITLRLEGDIELVGFAGQRELSWQTGLDAGTNLLSLPVLAHSLSDGRLVALVEHGGESSEFSIRLRAETRQGL